MKRTTLAPMVCQAAICTGLWLVGPASTFAGARPPQPATEDQFAGSVSCRQCHERFYELWAPSHHGLAMQPYTAGFARTCLTAQPEAVSIGSFSYRVDIEGREGAMVENGPEGRKRYEIVHVLGGKNVYYFLTPYERGRLQTLPLAYDVHQKQWFDTAASGVRHFPGVESDAPVHWTDPLYTFNTSCYTCHVSQLSRNYDLDTDTYHTEWAEPGINCEACHGPGEAHVKLYQRAEETGVEPNDLGLISTHTFSAEQMNSMCNSCHAKMSPITASFTPGERYFDHFDLVTLENRDFYPDGRDLGENYTMTSWRMSPCAKGGQLDCMHCHTSSGRYRFREPAQANNACLPCHQSRVDAVAAHSHHEPVDGGPTCVSCHMPMTRFAHMNRTDHSMRPPVPAATLKYESDNACNLCHQDQDAAWAQQQVKEWGMVTRQKQYLQLADYVDQARRQNWSNLDQILAYVQRKDRDEVFAGSLIRLLRACDSDEKWIVLVKVLENDPSPLVRAAAVEALDGSPTAASFRALVGAANDEYRLVRVRAAAALAAVPLERYQGAYQAQVGRATNELMASLHALPDDYTSHYNLGNIYMERRDHEKALDAYQTAVKLRPDFMPPHVNMAFVYNATGDNDKAEASFRKALVLDPNSPIVHLNLGMLLGELKRPKEAEQAFRAALKADPNSAAAAYNLGVLIAEDRSEESLKWCRQAFRLRPNDGKYGYTYAFFLHQRGQTTRAVAVLEGIVNRKVPYGDAYALLGSIYLQRGDRQKAIGVYRAAQANERLDPRARSAFEAMVLRLQQ
ncbi:MAG: ammonia-forming cytochrome c nitrite reductase subunit c552 [Phycisphaerales bacterium]|nr:MAG: ammonia-forming cytochrome c nitrite reductase subunit c552 [Phycisphaerales bacterium]